MIKYLCFFRFLKQRRGGACSGNCRQDGGHPKTFGDVLANNKVCLEIRKGEILSLLGENGSGKTTLMNVLSGIYFPDSGRITVNGKEVTIRSPRMHTIWASA